MNRSPVTRAWVRLVPRLGALVILGVVAAADLAAQAPTPGQNVNMVSGTQLPGGDPFLQRQNEPSMAVSSRNPLHLLAGANDYRTVDLPGLPGDETGDAWLGFFKSTNGGLSWFSGLVPGYPQDQTPEGLSSPIHGFAAAADPTVRPGTNGLFFYSGIAFNRGTNAPGAIFVARFIDNNNKENGDPTQYLSTAMIDSGNAGQFIDKPWLAVDVPLAGAPMCTIPTTPPQSFPAGNAYIAYAVFPGSNNNQILFARSTDCGATWTKPTKLSEGQQLSQGVTMVLSPVSAGPSTPHPIYVAWRRFANPNATDAVLVASSLDGGQTFTKATVVANILPFDQATTTASFRTEGFPSMAIDQSGRVYIAWSQRDPSGNARIAISTSSDGVTWTQPAFVDPAPVGQQFMPSITFTAGKLMVLYYDSREDHTIGLLAKACPVGQACVPLGPYFEYRQAVADPGFPGPFPGFVSDAGLSRRRTLDVRTAQADPGASPAFGPSTRVSSYYYGSSATYASQLGLPSDSILQLQYNPPNLPMFQIGTVPFIGDYIDYVGPVLTASGGGWSFASPSNTQIAHAVWADNRDVRGPTAKDVNGNPDWTQYTPPTVSGTGVICSPGNAGMRNQNLYTSRVSQGVLFQALENAKPLSQTLQRGFVVLVTNLTGAVKRFQLAINNQPVGGAASFLQSSVLTTLDLQVAPKSSVSRTIYVTSSDVHASVTSNLQELDLSTGTILAGGAQGQTILNADATNPNVTNPDVTDPNVANPDILSAEVYNPNVTNPNVTNPNVTNPNVTNPDVTDPNVTNTVLLNPNVTNPNVTNPDVTDPNVTNPNVTNPNVTNTSLSDFNVSESSSTVTNTGNTSSSYNVNLLATDPMPASFGGGTSFIQLIVTKTLVTQTADGCAEVPQAASVVVANVVQPVLRNISDTLPADTDAAVAAVTTPDVVTGAVSNATLALQPGETASVRVRVFQTKTDLVGFDPSKSVSPVAVAHGANSNNPAHKAPFAVRLTVTSNNHNLPVAVANKPYTATLKAVGGKGTLTWSISAGALPKGLSLSSTGVISGTTKVSGPYPLTFAFTVLVSDPNGNQFTKALTLIVNNK
jgi:Putative Ig domain